jgi:ketosteroid isomerase-like protein
MFRLVKIMLVCISFITIFSCQQAVDIGSEENSLRTLIDNYNNAFDQKDFVQFVQYCTDDVEFFTFDGGILPAKNLVESITTMVKDFEELHTEISELHIDLSDSIAWAKYKEILTFKLQGKPNEMHNLITVIFRKDGGSWKISHVHMSTSTPIDFENKS